MSGTTNSTRHFASLQTNRQRKVEDERGKQRGKKDKNKNNKEDTQENEE